MWYSVVSWHLFFLCIALFCVTFKFIPSSALLVLLQDSLLATANLEVAPKFSELVMKVSGLSESSYLKEQVEFNKKEYP